MRMTTYPFSLSGARLEALPSGGLWWPDRRILVVSDLHLGKAERHARKGGPMLPPYETRDTLFRLEADITRTNAQTIICLGDSFDDNMSEQNLPDDEKLWIVRLQAGRKWIWITGNHDPGPLELGGSHLSELPLPPLVFRHETNTHSSGEISGHFHPKAQLSVQGRGVSRPCFLIDMNRVIMPAYGTFTGGLGSHLPPLSTLMRPDALAVLTGKSARPIPMPR
jgi:DNA ligase-associated metallophosphoesterase